MGSSTCGRPLERIFACQISVFREEALAAPVFVPNQHGFSPSKMVISCHPFSAFSIIAFFFASPFFAPSTHSKTTSHPCTTCGHASVRGCRELGHDLLIQDTAALVFAWVPCRSASPTHENVSVYSASAETQAVCVGHEGQLLEASGAQENAQRPQNHAMRSFF